MHDLVIFDCDGVLVDSEVISNEVLARMLTRQGLPTTLSEARRACQGALLTDVPELAGRMGIKQNYPYRELPTLKEEGKVEQRKDRGWHAVSAA